MSLNLHSEHSYPSVPWNTEGGSTTEQLRSEIAQQILGNILTEASPAPADVPPMSLAGIRTLGIPCKVFADAGPLWAPPTLHAWTQSHKAVRASDTLNSRNMVQTIDFFPRLLCEALTINAEFEGCVKVTRINTIVPFHRTSWARLLRICWDIL